jgi:hypothetical protein
VRRLRAELAAKEAAVREAREAEQEAVDEVERLSRDLALERLRSKVARRAGLGCWLGRVEERASNEACQADLLSPPCMLRRLPGSSWKRSWGGPLPRRPPPPAPPPAPPAWPATECR